MYTNLDENDWKKFFQQYDRSSMDETGTIRTYGNDMEEIYQMFKARMISEKLITSEGKNEENK